MKHSEDPNVSKHRSTAGATWEKGGKGDWNTAWVRNPETGDGGDSEGQGRQGAEHTGREAERMYFSIFLSYFFHISFIFPHLSTCLDEFDY